MKSDFSLLDGASGGRGRGDGGRGRGDGGNGRGGYGGDAPKPKKEYKKVDERDCYDGEDVDYETTFRKHY